MAQTATHTPGPIMAGIERTVAHFRADPDGADATPSDVLNVADQAAKIDARRAALQAAIERALAWSDRQPAMGNRLPPDVEDQLRAAIAKAEGQ